MKRGILIVKGLINIVGNVLIRMVDFHRLGKQE